MGCKHFKFGPLKSKPNFGNRVRGEEEKKLLPKYWKQKQNGKRNQNSCGQIRWGIFVTYA